MVWVSGVVVLPGRVLELRVAGVRGNGRGTQPGAGVGLASGYGLTSTTCALYSWEWELQVVRASGMGRCVADGVLATRGRRTDAPASVTRPVHLRWHEALPYRHGTWVSTFTSCCCVELCPADTALTHAEPWHQRHRSHTKPPGNQSLSILYGID